MSRAMRTAQTKALAPVAIVAPRTSTAPGLYHSNDERAPATKAATIKAARMEAV